MQISIESNLNIPGEMAEKLAFCGLTCSGCPIHLATIEEDKTRKRIMRETIAIQMASFYGTKPNVDEIDDCDGCTEAGRLFSGCAKCEIRKCGLTRGVENCAWCVDFACEKLNQIFLHEPGARERLTEIRKKG